jgi:hypothetical protein
MNTTMMKRLSSKWTALALLMVCRTATTQAHYTEGRGPVYCWYKGEYGFSRPNGHDYVSAVFQGEKYAGVRDRVYARAFDRFIKQQYGETYLDTSDQYYLHHGSAHSQCSMLDSNTDLNLFAHSDPNMTVTTWKFSGDETDPGVNRPSGARAQ